MSIFGCGPSNQTTYSNSDGQIAAVWQAANGVQISVPNWLSQFENTQVTDTSILTYRQEAILEVDAANFPVNWKITLEPPKFYSLDFRILVTGETGQGWSQLGIRNDSNSLPFLPSAIYEATNARTGTESGGAPVKALIYHEQHGIR